MEDNDILEVWDARRLSLIIPGKPIPQPRPRVNWFFRRVYNPTPHGAQRWRQEALQQIHANLNGGVLPFFNRDDPLVLKVTFVFGRPCGHFVGCNPLRGLRNSAANRFSRKRPDVDNLLKFAFDSLNGLAFPDDDQIVEVHACRMLSDDITSRTELSIHVHHPSDNSPTMVSFP